MAVNSPFVVIRNINVRLSIKEKTDDGNVMVTGGSAGTFVSFNKTFLDVRSITVSAKKNPDYDIIAIYDFGTEEDGGFTAYVIKREDGAFVDGEVSWKVRGI